MSDTLPLPKLEALLPLLGALANRVAKHGALDDDDLTDLLMPAKLEQTLWAVNEAKLWAAYLLRYRCQPEKMNKLARALEDRGVPEASAIFAAQRVTEVAVRGTIRQTEERVTSVGPIECVPRNISFGELTAGQGAGASLWVEGGPGTVDVPVGVCVTPANFGPEKTELFVRLDGRSSGHAIKAEITLRAGSRERKVEVTARWVDPVAQNSRDSEAQNLLFFSNLVKKPRSVFREQDTSSSSRFREPLFPGRTADGPEVRKLKFFTILEDGNGNPPSPRQASPAIREPPPQTQARGSIPAGEVSAAVSAPNVDSVQNRGAQYDEESNKLEAIARALWNEERARKQGVIVFQSSLFRRFRAGGFEDPEQLPGTALVKLSKHIQSSRACVLPRSYVLTDKDRASAESYYEFHGNGDEIAQILRVAIHISVEGGEEVLKGSIQMGLGSIAD